MSRSGYTDDCENLELYRATVERSIKGRRGQAFLRELATAMDAMPDKVLIRNELIDAEGDCCTIGVVCKARELDVSAVDHEDPQAVGDLVGIARSMAAEIEFENDDDWHLAKAETPEQRWIRMRKWVDDHLSEQVHGNSGNVFTGSSVAKRSV